MEFKAELEELEKRIASLRKSSALTNDLKDLKNEVDALLTRLLNLESYFNQTDLNKQDIISINTQINNISSKINNLESSLANSQETLQDLQDDVTVLNTVTNGINSELDLIDTQITSIEIDIASIQTNLSTLSSSVSSISDQISNLNTNVNSQANTILSLQSSINSMQTSINETEDTIESIESNLLNLSTSVNEYSTQLSEIDTSVQQSQEDISSLDLRVSALENSGGTAGGGDCNVIETFNMGVEENFVLGTRDNNNNSVYIFFRCEPTAKINVHLELNINDFPETEDSAIYRVYVDNSLLKTFEFTENFTDPMIIPLDFGFFPKKNSYRLKIEAEGAITKIPVIESMFVKMEGRNIVILNRHHDLHMQILDNTYYLTIQTGNNATYLEQSMPNLSQQGTAITNISGYGMLYRLYRHIRWQSTSWVSSTNKYVVVIGYGSEYKGGVLTLGNTTPTWRGDDIYDLYYTMRGGGVSYMLSGTTLNGKAKIALNTQFNSTNSTLYTITVNNVELEDKYVQCVPVYDHYLSTRTTNTSIGFILLDNNGYLYYLPERTATYIVELGFGTQPNAYVQEDDKTINVYYTHCGSTYKKTLVLNENTNKFELSSSVQVFPGVTEYLEGINGISIQKIDGSWQVVEST